MSQCRKRLGLVVVAGLAIAIPGVAFSHPTFGSESPVGPQFGCPSGGRLELNGSMLTCRRVSRGAPRVDSIPANCYRGGLLSGWKCISEMGPPYDPICSKPCGYGDSCSPWEMSSVVRPGGLLMCTRTVIPTVTDYVAPTPW